MYCHPTYGPHDGSSFLLQRSTEALTPWGAPGRCIPAPEQLHAVLAGDLFLPCSPPLSSRTPPHTHTSATKLLPEGPTGRTEDQAETVPGCPCSKQRPGCGSAQLKGQSVPVPPLSTEATLLPSGFLTTRLLPWWHLGRSSPRARSANGGHPGCPSPGSAACFMGLSQ